MAAGARKVDIKELQEWRDRLSLVTRLRETLQETAKRYRDTLAIYRQVQEIHSRITQSIADSAELLTTSPAPVKGAKIDNIIKNLESQLKINQTEKAKLDAVLAKITETAISQRVQLIQVGIIPSAEMPQDPAHALYTEENSTLLIARLTAKAQQAQEVISNAESALARLQAITSPSSYGTASIPAVFSTATPMVALAPPPASAALPIVTEEVEEIRGGREEKGLASESDENETVESDESSQSHAENNLTEGKQPAAVYDDLVYLVTELATDLEANNEFLTRAYNILYEYDQELAETTPENTDDADARSKQHCWIKVRRFIEDSREALIPPLDNVSYLDELLKIINRQLTFAFSSVYNLVERCLQECNLGARENDIILTRAYIALKKYEQTLGTTVTSMPESELQENMWREVQVSLQDYYGDDWAKDFVIYAKASDAKITLYSQLSEALAENAVLKMKIAALEQQMAQSPGPVSTSVSAAGSAASTSERTLTGAIGGRGGAAAAMAAMLAKKTAEAAATPTAAPSAVLIVSGNVATLDAIKERILTLAGLDDETRDLNIARINTIPTKYADRIAEVVPLLYETDDNSLPQAIRILAMAPPGTRDDPVAKILALPKRTVAATSAVSSSRSIGIGNMLGQIGAKPTLRKTEPKAEEAEILPAIIPDEFITKIQSLENTLPPFKSTEDLPQEQIDALTSPLEYLKFALKKYPKRPDEVLAFLISLKDELVLKRAIVELAEKPASHFDRLRAEKDQQRDLAVGVFRRRLQGSDLTQFDRFEDKTRRHKRRSTLTIAAGTTAPTDAGKAAKAPTRPIAPPPVVGLYPVTEKNAHKIKRIKDFIAGLEQKIKTLKASLETPPATSLSPDEAQEDAVNRQNWQAILTKYEAELLQFKLLICLRAEKEVDKIMDELKAGWSLDEIARLHKLVIVIRPDSYKLLESFFKEYPFSTDSLTLNQLAQKIFDLLQDFKDPNQVHIAITHLKAGKDFDVIKAGMADGSIKEAATAAEMTAAPSTNDHPSPLQRQRSQRALRAPRGSISQPQPSSIAGIAQALVLGRRLLRHDSARREEPSPAPTPING